MALTKVIGSGIGTVTNQFADANMATGSVIQVKNVDVHAQVSITATSYAAVSGLSIAFTCSSASNKILIITDMQTYKNNTTDNDGFELGVAAAGTAINYFNGYNIRGAGVNVGSYGTVGNSFYYHPNSTSAITYTVIARSTAGGAFLINANNASGAALDAANQSSTSTFTIMEVVV